MVLLDTHVWLWWLLGDGGLKNNERLQLDELAASGLLTISWVSLWETEMLERKGRITLLPDFPVWIKKAADPSFIKTLPVDIEVVLEQRNLPGSCHRDPTDRLIAATAKLSGFELATHDSRIIESAVCKIWKPSA